MNILLAEDDTRLGKLVERMLIKKGGYHVQWVLQGDDAYQYALESHFDVLILDWMMPNEDGISVCKRLRNKGYMGAILMVTAKDSLEDRRQGLEAGANDYLIKPFDFEELLNRLHALTDSVIQ